MSFVQRYQNQVDPLRSERYVELIVLALLALLVLQLLWGAYRSVFPALPAPVQPTADALEIQTLHTAAAVVPEMRSEIRQRPLFWVTRRPDESVSQEDLQVDEALAEQAKPGKIKGLQLAGVFGAGESAGIIVLDKEKNKKHRLMVNQSVGGWNLESVSPTEAVFTSNGRQATLALKRGKILVPDVEPAPAPTVEVERPVASDSPGTPKADGGSSVEKKPLKSPRPKTGANEDGLTLGRGSRQ